jgi:multidrug transporter EmrE-like cation transporter
MAWAILIAAGLFETAFAVFLKLSHGLTQADQRDPVHGRR